MEDQARRHDSLSLLINSASPIRNSTSDVLVRVNPLQQLLEEHMRFCVGWDQQ